MLYVHADPFTNHTWTWHSPPYRYLIWFFTIPNVSLSVYNNKNNNKLLSHTHFSCIYIPISCSSTRNILGVCLVSSSDRGSITLQQFIAAGRDLSKGSFFFFSLFILSCFFVFNCRCHVCDRGVLIILIIWVVLGFIWQPFWQ